MPELYRKIDVRFSKAEIEEILTDCAVKLVRSEFGRPDEHRVCHVEGEAVVTLTIWPPEVRRRMKAEERARQRRDR